jgi:PAS domain S-box-containing protein
MKAAAKRWIEVNFKVNTELEPRKLRPKFLQFFLAMSFLLGFLAILSNLVIFISRPDLLSGAPVAVDVLAILAGWLIFILNRQGRTNLAGYLFTGMWLAGLAMTTDPAGLEQKLALFAVPTVAASFILTSSCSLFSASISVLIYTLEYFVLRSGQPFNYLFIVSLFTVAIGAWFVSEELNKSLSAAQKSENRYLNLLEHGPSVTYMASGAPYGRLSYVSPRIQSVLGFTPQEWIEIPDIWLRQIHPDDRSRVEAEWNRDRHEHLPFHAEYRLLHRSGKVVWISDDALPVQSTDGETQIQGIMLDITPRRRAEAIQAVLYHISQAANSAQDLAGLFQEIHSALGSLMHAENFFIALCEAGENIVQFPYYVDQVDSPPPPQRSGHGLTEYVMNTGQPLFASPEKYTALVKTGEVDIIGTPAVDWLGVPLKIGERTIGVMAVQSYTEGIRFNNEDLDILTFVSAQAARVIERKRSEVELRISEMIYHTTIDALDEMIHVEDRDQRIMMISNSFRRRNERIGLPFDMLGKTLAEAFPYLSQDLFQTYRDIFVDGEKRAMITDLTINGHHFIYDANLLPVLESGQVVRVITVLRDVTAEKQAEEKIKAALREKEVLLREIHHRVKNNLQVMSSLLSLQAEYIQDAHTLELFRETQSRLRSMALIHEELYQSRDLAQINYAEYIEKLTTNLFQAFCTNPNLNLDLDLDDIYLNIETAIPCGLIINELVTNAIKYAFPAGRPGLLTVHLKIDPQAAPKPCYILQIDDNGVGLPGSVNVYNTETLGLQLVNILVKQLRASLHIDNQNGAHFTIQFGER